MKKLIGSLLAVTFVFAQAQWNVAWAAEKEAVGNLLEQTLEEGVYYEAPEDPQNTENTTQPTPEQDAVENNRYIVNSAYVEQEVYNYMFENMDGIYGIMDDLLQEKGLRIKDAYMGMPFKVDTTGHGFDQYIFPVFIEDVVVGTVFVQKHYYDEQPEGVFGLTLGDVFHDVITNNAGGLYLFKFDSSTFAADQSGIKEIYGYSTKADSPEVARMAALKRNTGSVDISEELLSFSALESQKKNDARYTVRPEHRGKVTLNVKWVGQDVKIAETCWAAALACIWEYQSGRLITVREWCYSVHGNTCINRGYCKVSSPKEERAAVYALIGKERARFTHLLDMSVNLICDDIKYADMPVYSYGVNTRTSKEHAVVIYGYDYRGTNQMYFKLIDSNKKTEAYSLYTRVLENTTHGYQYFVNGDYTHYYYNQLFTI